VPDASLAGVAGDAVHVGSCRGVKVPRLADFQFEQLVCGWSAECHFVSPNAADRIETLNAILKAAEESLGDQLAARKEQADRIEAQAAEIERLRVEAEAHYDRGYYDGSTAALEQTK